MGSRSRAPLARLPAPLWTGCMDSECTSLSRHPGSQARPRAIRPGLSKRAAFVLLLSVLAGQSVAQSVIVPLVANTRPPRGTANAATFWGTGSPLNSESHTQLFYDVNDVPVSVATWTSMQIRRSPGSHDNYDFSTNASIRMAVRSSPHSSVSSTFTVNLPTSTVTVFGRS